MMLDAAHIRHKEFIGMNNLMATRVKEPAEPTKIIGLITVRRPFDTIFTRNIHLNLLAALITEDARMHINGVWNIDKFSTQLVTVLLK